MLWNIEPNVWAPVFKPKGYEVHDPAPGLLPQVRPSLTSKGPIIEQYLA